MSQGQMWRKLSTWRPATGGHAAIADTTKPLKRAPLGAVGVNEGDLRDETRQGHVVCQDALCFTFGLDRRNWRNRTGEKLGKNSKMNWIYSVTRWFCCRNALRNIFVAYGNLICFQCFRKHIQHGIVLNVMPPSRFSHCCQLWFCPALARLKSISLSVYPSASTAEAISCHRLQSWDARFSARPTASFTWRRNWRHVRHAITGSHLKTSIFKVFKEQIKIIYDRHIL